MLCDGGIIRLFFKLLAAGDRSNTPHDVGNSLAIVVGWYNNADFPCFHLLAYIHALYLIII